MIVVVLAVAAVVSHGPAKAVPRVPTSADQTVVRTVVENVLKGLFGRN